MLEEDKRLIRAPHLALEWEDGLLTVVAAREGSRFQISPEIAEILHEASTPLSAYELAERTRVNTQLIEHLVSIRLLVPEAENIRSIDDHWSTFELAVQRLSGSGGARQTCTNNPSTLSLTSKSRSSRCIELPLSSELPDYTIMDLLRSRRSRRQFTETPLSLNTLGDLLNYSAGVQHGSHELGYSLRPYPSGGACHPLEIYVLTINVEGLPRAAYRFDAFNGSLYEVTTTRDRLDEICTETDAYTGGLTGVPGVILIITAVFARTMYRYQNLGLTLVHKDVGGLFQTLYLVSTALGLSSVAVGGGPESLNAKWLGLDPMEESQVGCFVVG